ALGDEARVLEDIEGDLESRARDLHVGRPAAELLVVRDRRREDGPVDVREEPRLGLRDLGRRGLEEPGARRGEARERDRSDRLADGRHDMPDAIVLELLRRRPLLVDIVALTAAE